MTAHLPRTKHTISPLYVGISFNGSKIYLKSTCVIGKACNFPTLTMEKL